MALFRENMSVFEIDKQHGTILLAKPIDYEKQRLYNLKIWVYDGRHYAYGTLQINILDENDNVPIFVHVVYTVDVRSKLKQNTYITKVSATDLDQGDYGNVQYKIDTPMDAFTIEQDTGIIFTNKRFQFAPELESFDLIVAAFDSFGRDGSHSSSAVVHFKISSKRSRYKFENKVYYMKVTERASIGAVVGRVRAFSSGIYKTVKYRIASGNIGQAFSVDAHRGLITVNNNLDREKKDSYSLKVVAVHDYNLSASCDTIITILDLNDNNPKFEKSIYHVSIKEDVLPGHSLITLKATDIDDPNTDYASIRYEIHSGQGKHAWLKIDPITGVVKTIKRLDREKAAILQLTIIAADNLGIS